MAKSAGGSFHAGTDGRWTRATRAVALPDRHRQCHHCSCVAGFTVVSASTVSWRGQPVTRGPPPPTQSFSASVFLLSCQRGGREPLVSPRHRTAHRVHVEGCRSPLFACFRERPLPAVRRGDWWCRCAGRTCRQQRSRCPTYSISPGRPLSAPTCCRILRWPLADSHA